MKERTLEIALAVEDYDSFEDCKLATDDAKKEAEFEVASTLCVAWEDVTIDVKKIEFQEFDSSNRSHACGYFLVTFELDDETDEALSRTKECN